jgi:predicted MFS family arabinose efflux permease
MLILALIRGNDDGWSSTLIVSLLVGAVLMLTVFLVAEWRQDDPMLDLALFRRPAMTGVSLTALTLSASIFALFLYLTLYIQDDLGYGPLAAGIRFLPLTVLAFIVAPIAGKLTVRIHARYLLGTGLLLIAIGCLVMSMTHASSSWTVLLPGFVIAGIGIGTVNPVLASSAISVVPPERSGMASGANSTFRQVGIATGIAGLGSIFQSQIQQKTLHALASTQQGQAVITHGGAALKSAILGGGVHQAAAGIPSAASRAALVNAYRVGFSASLNSIMEIGAVIALVGSIGAFVLIRQRDFVPSYAPPSDRTPTAVAEAVAQ